MECLCRLDDKEFERRAALRDADRMPAEVLEGMKPARIGLIGDDHADALEPALVPCPRGDDLQRPLACEIIERGGDAG